MSTVRRILGQCAVACVLLQAAGVVLPPALLWATMTADSECTCMTGDHAMCPMHHHSRSGCAMRAAADTGTALLAPLAIFGVLPAHSVPATLPPPSSVIARFDTTGARDRAVVPEAPPPRA